MERKITITPAVKPLPQHLRVAAYARVSLGTEHMLHSLAAQVSYYSKYIQSRADWEYAGVYADADETGTKDTRPEFQRLLADCRDGKIDKVITKSISRFARNTVTLLETVRELKNLGIGVWFEEQNIDTLTGDGELMMTIIAGFAQEESRSVSENIKWRKRNDMKNGKTKPVKVYGYEVIDGELIINPDEADVVRMMFDYCLAGLGRVAIADKLNWLGIPSKSGGAWNEAVVGRLLSNPKMCGDLLHQRTFVADHLSKKQITNRGELPMYLLHDTHEGIVSREIFDAVQEIIAKRGNDYEGRAFRKSIYCGNCGRVFWHSTGGRGINKYYQWKCSGYDKRSGLGCMARGIPEPVLMAVTAEVLGLDEYDGDVFGEKVERIIAHDDRMLTYLFKDGSKVDKAWQRRKTIPYSKIGFDKRQGRNICYSKIGKGNGKIAKRKEAEHNAERTSDTSEET